MKRTLTTMGALVAATTPAFASGSPEPAGTGLLVVLFVAFGLAIVLLQLVPGAVLLGSLVKTLVSDSQKKSLPAGGR